MDQPSAETTLLLSKAFHEGDADARAHVFESLRDELQRLAAALMAKEQSGHSWEPSDLLQECVIKLLGGKPPTVAGRTGFFAAAKRAMLQLLVDHARHRKTQKAGGGVRPGSLEACLTAIESHRIGLQPVDVAALHEALAELERLHPRQSAVFTGTFVGGLTVGELAALLSDPEPVSEHAIRQDLQHAREFLYQKLRG
jgi:RNA polymerase sigma factor (TIGR02999 family)